MSEPWSFFWDYVAPFCMIVLSIVLVTAIAYWGIARLVIELKRM